MQALSCFWSSHVPRSPKRGDDRLSEQECSRAWMMDISGANGVESFTAKVQGALHFVNAGHF